MVVYVSQMSSWNQTFNTPCIYLLPQQLGGRDWTMRACTHIHRYMSGSMYVPTYYVTHLYNSNRKLQLQFPFKVTFTWASINIAWSERELHRKLEGTSMAITMHTRLHACSNGSTNLTGRPWFHCYQRSHRSPHWFPTLSGVNLHISNKEIRRGSAEFKVLHRRSRVDQIELVLLKSFRFYLIQEESSTHTHQGFIERGGSLRSPQICHVEIL